MSFGERYFLTLSELVARRKLEVVLTLCKSGPREHLRIEVRSGDRVIDYQGVGAKETVDAAAKRLLMKMRKDRVIDA